MSMICILRQVTDAQIDWLLSRPDEISFFLFGPDDEEPAAPPSGCLGRLFGAQPAPPPAPARDWTPPAEGEEIELEKAWAGIHYLLAGDMGPTDSPLSFIMGGVEIGEDDIGYGPARAVRAADVRAIQAGLQPITPDAFRARYNPAELNAEEVYPAMWDDDDALDYLVEYYEMLKAFIDDAAARNHGLIIYLT